MKANEESIIETRVYLSVKAALESADSPQWIGAISKEKTKLESTKTWRGLAEEESASEKT